MHLKSSSHDTSLTSAHVLCDRYATFKNVGASNDMTLQRLINRCIYLYTTDADFRAKVDRTSDLKISGSAF